MFVRTERIINNLFIDILKKVCKKVKCLFLSTNLKLIMLYKMNNEKVIWKDQE